MKTIIIIYSLLLGYINPNNRISPSSFTVQQQEDVDLIYIFKTKDGKELIAKGNNVMFEAEDIESLESLNNSEIDRKFGKSNKKRIVCIVICKPSVKILNKTELLGAYKIGQQQRRLPMQFKGRLLLDKEDILITENSLKRVNMNVQNGQIVVRSKNTEKQPAMNPNTLFIK